MNIPYYIDKVRGSENIVIRPISNTEITYITGNEQFRVYKKKYDIRLSDKFLLHLRKECQLSIVPANEVDLNLGPNRNYFLG